MEAKKRIFGLDLMRVVAVLAVIYAHAGHFTFYGIEYGYVAIESFFVMSGFLIGEMLIRDFKDGFTFSELKIFWVKRWFRTLPLYYFVLFFKFFFLNPEHIGKNILYYVFFLQNNFYGIKFFSVSWTLVLEEWFYMIMPLLIFILFRKGIDARKFYYFVLAVIIGSVLMRFFYGAYRSNSFDAMNGNFILRFDAFIVGVGLAAIKLFNYNSYKRLSKSLYFFIGVFILLLSQLFYYNKLGFNANELLGPGALATRFIVMDIGVFFLLPFMCESPIFQTKKEKNRTIHVLTWISLLSYPMYLIHMEVQHYIPQLLPQIYFGNHFSDFLTNTLITILISYFIYELIHEPMIKLRSKAVKRLKSKLEKNKL